METAKMPPNVVKLPWPNQLRTRLQLVGLSPIAIVLWIALAIAPLFVSDEYTLRLVLVSLFFGAQAMAFDATVGYINVVNFGFAAFVGLGAYTSALMATRLGLSPWLGLLAGPIVAGALGFVTGVLTLRLRGIYAAVMAWFVGLTLMGLATVAVDITRGKLGLNVPYFFESPSVRPYFYLLLPIAFGTYVLLKWLTSSNAGLAFRAIGQNFDAARASGINPTKYRVLNFTVACGLAGLLGVFYAHYVGIITPGIMETKLTVEVLAIAYIGGRGSIWGGLVAAFLVIPVFESLKSLLEVRLIIYGLFLILTMIFYPGGLAGIIRSLGAWARQRWGHHA